MTTFFSVVATVLVMVGLVLMWGVGAAIGMCVLLGVAVGVRAAVRAVQRRRGPVPVRPAGPYRPGSKPPVDRRGARGSFRSPQRDPGWCARHAKPRRFDPHPDVPPVVQIALCDPDTAELAVPHDLIEENAA